MRTKPAKKQTLHIAHWDESTKAHEQFWQQQHRIASEEKEDIWVIHEFMQQISDAVSYHAHEYKPVGTKKPALCVKNALWYTFETQAGYCKEAEFPKDSYLDINMEIRRFLEPIQKFGADFFTPHPTPNSVVGAALLAFNNEDLTYFQHKKSKKHAKQVKKIWQNHGRGLKTASKQVKAVFYAEFIYQIELDLELTSKRITCSEDSEYTDYTDDECDEEYEYSNHTMTLEEMIKTPQNFYGTIINNIPSGTKLEQLVHEKFAELSALFRAEDNLSIFLSEKASITPIR